MLDLCIKNAKYPDFCKGTITEGNIEILNGRIVEINSPNKISSARKYIDAKGLIVSPGFVDIHMHEEDFLNDGECYIISNLMLKQGVTTCFGGQCGVQRQSIDDFKRIIAKLGGAPVNYVCAIGYNAIREMAGVSRHGNPTKEQKEVICGLISKEERSGASGLSFGIEYDPGISKNEIIDAVGCLKNKELLVSAHYRADNKNAISSIREMIDIHNSIPNPFQISHLSSCSAMGAMRESLYLINEEIEKNSKLDYDTYPYDAFSTSIGSEVFKDGCIEEWGSDYSDILLTDEPYKNIFCNKEIFEKCRKEYPDMLAVAFVMNEDEIKMAIADKNGMIASDGILNHGNGHPRAAGTFPRVLGKYVRDEKIISLYSALEKMTIRPADRLGLNTKGRIQVGADADITIFDPNNIGDRATFTDSNLESVGIEAVIINGEIAVKDNVIINDRLGKFISYA